MPIILAVEPDHKQAARLAAIVRHHVGAELVIGDTTERALDALGSRVPDMVLVPALLSPQDDASLATALRVIAAEAHVRTLTIPVLGSGKQQSASGGLLSRFRRGRAESPEPDGCDPAVFAEQITAYLKEAAAERARARRLSSIAGRRYRRPVSTATRGSRHRSGRPGVRSRRTVSLRDLHRHRDVCGRHIRGRYVRRRHIRRRRVHALRDGCPPAETFAAAEAFTAPRTLSAAERYAGAETFETATYDATLPRDEQDANVDTASPALDLSSELGSLAPPANDQRLYKTANRSAPIRFHRSTKSGRTPHRSTPRRRSTHQRFSTGQRAISHHRRSMSTNRSC